MSLSELEKKAAMQAFNTIPQSVWQERVFFACEAVKNMQGDGELRPPSRAHLILLSRIFNQHQRISNIDEYAAINDWLKALIATATEAALAPQEPKAEQPFQSAAEYAAYREESGDYRAKQPPAPAPDGDVVEKMWQEYLAAHNNNCATQDDAIRAGMTAALRVAREGYVALEDVEKEQREWKLDRARIIASANDEVADLANANKVLLSANLKLGIDAFKEAVESLKTVSMHDGGKHNVEAVNYGLKIACDVLGKIIEEQESRLLRKERNANER